MVEQKLKEFADLARDLEPFAHDAELAPIRLYIAFRMAEEIYRRHFGFGDADLDRLATLVWALQSGQVASQFGEDLPATPGKSSAFALCTIFSQDWTIDDRGQAIPPTRRRPENTDPTPDAAGRTWFKRIRRNLESVELQSDDDMILIKRLLLDAFLGQNDKARLKVNDP